MRLVAAFLWGTRHAFISASVQPLKDCNSAETIESFLSSFVGGATGAQKMFLLIGNSFKITIFVCIYYTFITHIRRDS